MYKETYSTYCYKAVDDYINVLEQQRLVGSGNHLGYSHDSINSRLIQKITSMITSPFLKYSLNNYENGNKNPPKISGNLILGDLKISSEANVSPTSKLYIKNISLYFSLWLYLLLKTFLKLKQKKTENTQSIILYGVPNADLNHKGNDKRFSEFVNEGPIKILNSSPSVYVQADSRLKSHVPGKLHYSKYPLLDLFLETKCTLKECIKFIILHIVNMFSTLLLFIRYPISVLLWRDFAEHSVAMHLNTFGIINDVIITNTNWIQQLLWMTDLPNKKFKLHMALYSQNSDLINYKKEPLEHISHPSLRHLHVDNIYIWEDDYSSSLKNIGIDTVTTTIGPILWYMPKLDDLAENNEIFTICVFDITPMTTEAIKSRGLLASYYSLENSIMFIDDLVSAVKNIENNINYNIKIILKHKRAPHSGHDMSYFEHISSLEKNGVIEIESSDVNVYSLINNSDISVVIPFSSAAYISRKCNKPAIFYDPSNKIIGEKYATNNVYFVAGQEGLTEKLKVLCGR